MFHSEEEQELNEHRPEQNREWARKQRKATGTTVVAASSARQVYANLSRMNFPAENSDVSRYFLFSLEGFQNIFDGVLRV